MNVKLTITVLPDGHVEVEGPIDNKVLCYGMLECAKDAIRAHNEKKDKSAILPVTIKLP